MEKEIKEQLNKIGVKINRRGYYYWVTAIQYVISENGFFKMGDVCEYIAKTYNTTIAAVDRALRFSIEGTQTYLRLHFGIDYKINNRVFLNFMVEKIKEGK